VTTGIKSGENFNRYKYASANPYTLIDPDGRYDKEGYYSQAAVESRNQEGRDVAKLLAIPFVSTVAYVYDKQYGEAAVSALGTAAPLAKGAGATVESAKAIEAGAKLEELAKKGLDAGAKLVEKASTAAQKAKAEVYTNPLFISAVANADKISDAVDAVAPNGPPPPSYVGLTVGSAAAALDFGMQAFESLFGGAESSKDENSHAKNTGN
jgi:hypothetical protein